MKFNYTKEKNKFDSYWKKIEIKYRNAGMSDEAIDEIYNYDFSQFKKRRNQINHASDISLDESFEDGVNIEQILYKYDYFTKLEDELFLENNDWIEKIHNEELVKKLKKLDSSDLELVRLIIIEGHTQTEIANKFHISQKNISKKLTRIKKFLI